MRHVSSPGTSLAGHGQNALAVALRVLLQQALRRAKRHHCAVALMPFWTGLLSVRALCQTTSASLLLPRKCHLQMLSRLQLLSGVRHGRMSQQLTSKYRWLSVESSSVIRKTTCHVHDSEHMP